MVLIKNKMKNFENSSSSGSYQRIDIDNDEYVQIDLEKYSEKEFDQKPPQMLSGTNPQRTRTTLMHGKFGFHAHINRVDKENK
jgi:hypothetical protein